MGRKGQFVCVKSKGVCKQRDPGTKTKQAYTGEEFILPPPRADIYEHYNHHIYFV